MGSTSHQVGQWSPVKPPYLDQIHAAGDMQLKLNDRFPELFTRPLGGADDDRSGVLEPEDAEQEPPAVAV
jgi:hypothetical protein